MTKEMTWEDYCVWIIEKEKKDAIIPEFTAVVKID